MHVEDGSLAWYYQEVPGERWDYTATMKMILADLEIGGRTRKVLMQAPKDGFFYVLDRATGELISAKNFTFVNWAKGIDAKTGRPIPNPAADYHGGAKLVYPSQAGAHNWQPMSYDPDTGLVYIPTIDMPMVYIDTAKRPAGLVEGAFTVPGIPPEAYDPAGMRSLFGPLPTLEELAKRGGDWRAPKSRGELRAWDPIAGRIAWAQPGASFWDGGAMSTAGGLVFRGDAAGFLNVYAATDGRQLAHIEVGSSIMAAPMTYSIGGEQYVAVMAGYGGGGGFAFPPDSAAYQRGNQGRIIVLKLGGGAVPLPPPLVDAPMPRPPAGSADAATIARGEVLYNRYCGRCHVFGRGLLPDLRRMSAATQENFQRIVFEGAYVPKGMGRWDDVLARADADAIHADQCTGRGRSGARSSRRAPGAAHVAGRLGCGLHRASLRIISTAIASSAKPPATSPAPSTGCVAQSVASTATATKAAAAITNTAATSASAKVAATRRTSSRKADTRRAVRSPTIPESRPLSRPIVPSSAAARSARSPIRVSLMTPSPPGLLPPTHRETDHERDGRRDAEGHPNVVLHVAIRDLGALAQVLAERLLGLLDPALRRIERRADPVRHVPGLPARIGHRALHDMLQVAQDPVQVVQYLVGSAVHDCILRMGRRLEVKVGSFRPNSTADST
ncbi:MAG: c-type cytochrome [Steroidobacteraceae bacterium]